MLWVHAYLFIYLFLTYLLNIIHMNGFIIIISFFSFVVIVVVVIYFNLFLFCFVINRILYMIDRLVH